jgi:hypothetical protein
MVAVAKHFVVGMASTLDVAGLTGVETDLFATGFPTIAASSCAAHVCHSE